MTPQVAKLQARLQQGERERARAGVEILLAAAMALVAKLVHVLVVPHPAAIPLLGLCVLLGFGFAGHAAYRFVEGTTLRGSARRELAELGVHELPAAHVVDRAR